MYTFVNPFIHICLPSGELCGTLTLYMFLTFAPANLAIQNYGLYLSFDPNKFLVFRVYIQDELPGKYVAGSLLTPGRFGPWGNFSRHIPLN